MIERNVEHAKSQKSMKLYVKNVKPFSVGVHTLTSKKCNSCKSSVKVV